MDGTFTTGGIKMELLGFDVVASNMTKWFQGQMQKRINAAERMSQLAEPFMKQNAPWRDDTGDARGSLKAVAQHEATKSTVVLSHGVYYGAALETMQGGRYGVLLPTIGWLVSQLSSIIASEMGQ